MTGFGPLATGSGPLVTVVAGLLAAALLVVAITIGYVVNRDATARGVDDPARVLLTAGAILLPVLVVPAYALLTRRLGARTTPASDAELVLAWGAVTLFAAVIAGALLSPPDPVTQLWYVAGLVVVFGLVGLVPLARRGVVGAG